MYRAVGVANADAPVLDFGDRQPQIGFAVAGRILIEHGGPLSVAVGGLVVLGLTAFYVEAKIEDWVAEYNERLDSEIRRLLAAYQAKSA